MDNNKYDIDGINARELKRIQKEFMESYVASKDKLEVEEWLIQELKKHLPKKKDSDVIKIGKEIIESLKITEEKKQGLEDSVKKGRSKESWFAVSLEESVSQMSVHERSKYLQSLDEAVKNANEAMHETITTKSSGYSIPSKNPNLDGFIAEQHHVNSFNMDAVVKGSGLRAEVQPLKEGGTYSKNGFDVIIKDQKGKRIHQYQMKYGATAEDTIRMLKSGNYNNQTIIVPAEQVEAVQKAFPKKTVSSFIGEGNVKSKPLTKESVKELQKDAQQGTFNETSWSDWSAKDIALGIGKQTGYACVQGLAVGAGMEIAEKIWNEEPISGDEVIEKALVTGSDFGVKTATAGALKVASEKGKIKFLPKGTDSNVFANIAFVAVENVKVLGKVATGELTVKEGIENMEQTTVSCVAGLTSSVKGAEIGSAVGAVLGPVGSAVGGFVGGTVGYMASSTIGQQVVKGCQKVRDKLIETGKNIGNKLKSFCESVKTAIFSFW